MATDDDVDVFPDLRVSKAQYEMMLDVKQKFFAANQDLSPDEQGLFDLRMMHRYLVATQKKKWRPAEAVKKLQETLKWRREVKPQSISSRRCRRHFETGKNYFKGFDKYGRPIIYVRVRLDTPCDYEGKVKAMLYQLERGMRLVRERRGDWVPPAGKEIMDLSGFSRQHMSRASMRVNKSFAGALNAHYPESLGKCFIISAPGIFRGLWVILGAFIDANTKSKISMVKGLEASHRELLECVDDDDIEREFGGKDGSAFDAKTYMDMLVEEEGHWYEGDDPDGSIEDHEWIPPADTVPAPNAITVGAPTADDDAEEGGEGVDSGKTEA